MNCGVFLNAVINNLNSLVKDVYRVLKQKGIFTVSLYNSGALVSQLVNELDWEPSLSVRFTDAKNSLKVVFQGKKFNIAAKTYSVQECRDILSQYFEIVELSTFPTISSVLPNSLFGHTISYTISYEYPLNPSCFDLNVSDFITSRIL